MGLFDKFKKKEKQPDKDMRPYAPNEVTWHRSNECVEVLATKHHQDVIERLRGDTVQMRLRKGKKGDWHEYVVETMSGDVVGGIYAERFKQKGLSTGVVTVEIARPTYYFEYETKLYIQLTPEQIAWIKKREKSSRK